MFPARQYFHLIMIPENRGRQHNIPAHFLVFLTVVSSCSRVPLIRPAAIASHPLPQNRLLSPQSVLHGNVRCGQAQAAGWVGGLPICLRFPRGPPCSHLGLSLSDSILQPFYFEVRSRFNYSLLSTSYIEQKEKTKTRHLSGVKRPRRKISVWTCVEKGNSGLTVPPGYESSEDNVRRM